MATSKKKQYCDLLTPVVCDECGGQNDVTNYCLQCNANICNACKATHCNTRLHRDHKVLSRTHTEVVRARRSKKVYCPRHRGKEYVTYCTRCEQPCCAVCITEEHDGHRFCDLEKAISETESEIHVLVHDLETDLIPISENAFSTLEMEIVSYKRASYKVKEYANKKKKQQIQKINKAHEVFLMEVDTQVRKDMEIMEKEKLELKKYLEKVKFAVNKGKTAPIDASILLIKDELVEASSKPGQIKFPGKLSFTASDVILSSVHDAIGSFKNDPDTVLFASTKNEDGATDGRCLDPKTVKVLKTINGINARSTVCFPNNDVWIYNESINSIDVYNEQFTRTKRINVDFSCRDMTRYSVNEVLATDSINDRILRISRSGEIVILCSTDKCWIELCVNNKQHIVAGVIDECLSTDLCRWKLIIYSPDESSVLQEMTQDQMFMGDDIRQIRQTVSGEYVVAIDEKVICLSTDLNNKWTYEFESNDYCGTIRSLYCDKYNNILVGDSYKNEIVMLSIDGQRIRTLLTEQDGICEPLSMDVDGKGHLWIGQRENVLIATYLK
ncbi:hypothetical protein FSP39_010091 [Pinctada imbricata]|uniref:B box-type domain-containing protein n=1 Tax=Pinctada imbricata TaxID=66713 RepID=A0AA88Y5S7_PINIB|nr:hypothetical protein FSP39_010091 [Pinctada imbricata]